MVNTTEIILILPIRPKMKRLIFLIFGPKIYNHRWC